MSFTNIPDNIGPINVDLDSEDVAILLLASIAFEELGLAHILNSEAEKLQAALGTLVDAEGKTVFKQPLAKNLNDLLTVNHSVEKMLQTVIKKKCFFNLKLKMS